MSKKDNLDTFYLRALYIRSWCNYVSFLQLLHYLHDSVHHRVHKHQIAFTDHCLHHHLHATSQLCRDPPKFESQSYSQLTLNCVLQEFFESLQRELRQCMSGENVDSIIGNQTSKAVFTLLPPEGTGKSFKNLRSHDMESLNLRPSVCNNS